MSTALTVQTGEPSVRLERTDNGSLAPMSFEQIVHMGDALVRTGFLPEHIKNGAQAAAIILTGRELGLPPMRALRSLAMVKGKVTEYADSQLSRFKADGGRAMWKQLDEKAAVLQLRHPNGDEHEETFTFADAERAGLTKPGRSGEPSMFTKFPKAMLRSRAITAGLKSIGWEGGVGAYDPEELGGFSAPIPALGTDIESATDVSDHGAAHQSIDERAPLDEPEAKCPKCSGRMWDNRTSKTNAKAPDYKCRDKSCDGVFWPGQWPPAPAASTAQTAKIEELLGVADLSEKKAAKIRAQLTDTENPLNAKRADEIIVGLTKLVPSDNAAATAEPETETTESFEALAGRINAMLQHDKFTTDERKQYADRATKAKTPAQLQAIADELQKFIDSPF